MRFFEAKELFREAARAGRIPVRALGAGGGFKAIGQGRVRQVLSRVTLGVEAASLVTGAALEDVDVGPLLIGLPEAAARAAEREGLSSVRNVRSDASLFASVLLQQDVASRRLRVSPELFPAPWRPLALALVATPTRSGGTSRRSSLSELLVLAQVAGRHGVDEPAQLPDDPRAVQEWAGADEKLRTRLDAGVVAYRRARRVLAADAGDALPALLRTTRDREWGVNALQGLPALLRSAYDRLEPEEQARYADRIDTPDALTTVEKIAVLAPYFGAALEAYVQLGGEAAIARQPLYLEKVVGAVSRTVATMIRAGLDPHGRRFESLWLEQLPVAGAKRAAPARRSRLDEDDFVGTAVGLVGGDREGLEAADQESLLRRVLRESMALRIRGSMLQLTEAVTQGRAEYFTDSAFSDAKQLRYVALRVLKPRWLRSPTARRAGQARWAQLQVEHEGLMALMRGANGEAPARGRIDKSRLPCTYGNLAYVALWDLRRRVLEVDADLADVRAHQLSCDDSHRVQTLEARLRRRLRDYALVACIVADGLRNKNYCGAIAGIHFRPDVVRDQAGRWVGFSGMRTHYWGDDCPSVRLKVPKTRDRIRERTWRLSPGVVDLRLLFRYWTEVRPADLRAAGLLGPGEALDLDADRYAVFVSDEPVAGKKRVASARYAIRRPDGQGGWRVLSPGNLTDVSVRNIWASHIHRICRDVLRVPGVPARLEDCRKKGSEFRGLFGSHAVRSYVAFYWGGLRQDWARAEEYTNDSRQTLERDYAVLPADMQGKRGRGHLHDPELFTELLDLAFHPRSLEGEYDWGAFWRGFTPVRWVPAEQGQGGQWEQAFFRRPEEIAQVRALLEPPVGHPAAAAQRDRSRRGGRRGAYVGRQAVAV